MDQDNYRYLSVKNQSGEVVPPYAVMRIVETDKEDTIYISKPNKDNDKLIMLNGPSQIGIDGTGLGTIDMPFWAAFNQADGTPGNGEQWGTENGSWKLKKDKRGFLTIAMKGGSSPPIAGIVLVKFEECIP